LGQKSLSPRLDSPNSERVGSTWNAGGKITCV